MALTHPEIKALPKVDLHRHLEGSVRIETFLEIAKSRQISLPTYELRQLQKLISITDDLPDFKNFLNKFSLFQGFWPDREAIERVAYEAVEDAALDHVIYLELRYSPAHFARGRGFSCGDVVEWVTHAARRAANLYDIHVEFIATIGRHFPIEVNRPSIEIALDAGMERFVGLDVAGDELKFPLDAYAKYFEQAKEIGLGLTLHAGEVGPVANIREAILRFKADRIGHGVRLADSKSMIQLAIDTETCFEMCLTSNLQTGAVASFEGHPAKALLDQGICITLNSDDPAISQISLSDEYETAIDKAGFFKDDLDQVRKNAVNKAFLPDEEKAKILCRLKLQ